MLSTAAKNAGTPKRVIRRYLNLHFFAACLLLTALSRPAFSQANLGRIGGTVTDQSGGSIEGAAVTVLDVARGISRALITDNAGGYSAPNLTPGTYSVRVENAGFRTVDRRDVLVQVGQDIRVDIALQPGEQAQTVTVTGEAPAVNTTSSQLEGTIDNQTVSDLPVNGRQYRSLLTQVPGLISTPGTANNKQMGYNGTRPENLMYILDGVPSYNPHAGTPTIGGNTAGGGPDQSTILPVDAIQEINIIGNPKAEYGWKPGAQINIGLKSGTNAIHGSGFIFGRTDAFDAKNQFLSPSQAKAREELEQYGGTIGGPIKKDKLFYFGSFEAQNFAVGTPRIATLPTSISLGGATGPTNSFPDAIYDIVKNHATTPLSQLSLNLAGCPSAAAIGALLPTLTSPSQIVCNAANGLFGNGSASTSVPTALENSGGSHNMLGKVDYHVNNHHSLNGEFFYGDGAIIFSTAAFQPYWRNQTLTTVKVGRGVWAWTPNSSLVNEARFGYDNANLRGYPVESVGNFGQPNYASAFGFVSGINIPAGRTYAGFPFLTISGGFTSLGAANNPSTTHYKVNEFLDTVSYVHGKHMFKFGGEIRRTTGQTATFTNGKGVLQFGTGGVAAFTGATPLESFLAGRVSSGTVLLGDALVDLRWMNFAVFAQDDWRITPKLTLNIGLRYEADPAMTEKNHKVGGFDPSTPAGVFQESDGRTVYGGDNVNFMPRVGLAWDVSGRGTTVVRLGGGISYETTPNLLTVVNAANINSVPSGFALYNANGGILPSPGTQASGNLALGATYFSTNPSAATVGHWVATTPVFASGALKCGNGLAPAAPVAAGAPAINPPPCNIAVLSTDYPLGYVTTWTLGVQHAFTNNLSLDLAYVGNRGNHLVGNVDLNQPTPGAKNSNANSVIEQARRPYNAQFPYLAQISTFSSSQKSTYNALQAIFTQRVTHGLFFNVAYAWAHTLEQSPFSTGGGISMDARHPELEYSDGAFDARHNLSIAMSYAIPGIKTWGQFLEGWQLNANIKAMSSLPILANDTQGDLSGTGVLVDRWTLAGSPRDFDIGGPAHVPCWGVFSPSGTATANVVSSFGSSGACTQVGVPAGTLTTSTSAQKVANMPAACVAAAAAEPSGVNTGLDSLASLGCYMMGNSVIVPPAQGTFGSMGKNVLRGRPFTQTNLAVSKNWRFTERISSQFRAEFFNLFNSSHYAAAAANLNSPTTFGASQSTPDTVNPVIGTGNPRRIQLGLKVMF